MQKENQNGNQNDNQELIKEMAEGFLYNHIRINSITMKTLEASSFLYALVELLNEKGLLSIDELDERKKQVAGRLVKNFVESGIGLLYQDPEEDKYTFEQEANVDCLSRLHICKSICCKFPFALSRQDVEEGIIRWEFGRPYLIAHNSDSYCTHLDRKTYKCTARDHRPVPCRGFDCQDNKKWNVWLDYDNKILNPELKEQIRHSNDEIYSCPTIKSRKEL